MFKLGAKIIVKTPEHLEFSFWFHDTMHYMVIYLQPILFVKRAKTQKNLTLQKPTRKWSKLNFEVESGIKFDFW